MKPALLIIDIQQALCTGPDAAFDIDRVVDRINEAADEARAAGVPVLVIQHEEREGPLQHGTPGWQLYERLKVHAEDIRLRKTATDSFHRTRLDELLRSLGVDKLIICGLQSEFCIDSTARGALARGYGVVLISDAHSTVDNGVLSAAQITAHHNTTLANLGSFGPRVTAMPAEDVRTLGDVANRPLHAAGDPS
jgi:nicotinamidase-related amidase